MPTVSACPPKPATFNRRAFLRSLGAASADAPGRGDHVLSPSLGGIRERSAKFNPGHLTSGDVAILRFLAAAELIEADLWQQYTELAVGNASYANALSVLDSDMVQYISDNSDDEISHASFLNAFLQTTGHEPVDFDAFRTLPSSSATGAEQTGRLTSLTNLTVDTTWWIRYRSGNNPDFGDTFPQLVNIVNFPAIPLQDLPSGSDEIQAIANTAAFHFAAIEQAGSKPFTLRSFPRPPTRTYCGSLLESGGRKSSIFPYGATRRAIFRP